MADVIGILIIGVQLYWVVRWFVPDDDSRSLLGFFAYIVLAGSALYLWHREPPVENLSRPSQWALAILGSVLLGAASFGIDMLVGLIDKPKLTPIEAGTRAGSPFGFMLTVMICPGLTMLAIVGLSHAFLLRNGAAPAEHGTDRARGRAA